MTQHNEQETAKATPTPPVSVILAMHWRYDAATGEYDRLDNMRSAVSADDKHLNDNAQSALLREQDALRVAILRQVPDTWDEAAAMLFHISNSYDLIADEEGENWNQREGEALRIGLENLLDFVAAEMIRQPGMLGASFAIEVERVRKLRRRRSGHAEG